MEANFWTYLGFTGNIMGIILLFLHRRLLKAQITLQEEHVALLTTQKLMYREFIKNAMRLEPANRHDAIKVLTALITYVEYSPYIKSDRFKEEALKDFQADLQLLKSEEKFHAEEEH